MATFFTRLGNQKLNYNFYFYFSKNIRKLNLLLCAICVIFIFQILSLENDKGWIEMFESPLFTSNGELMLYIYSWDQGNNMGGYRHLTIYNTTKRTASPLTQGKFTVTQILAWDKLNNIVYEKYR